MSIRLDGALSASEARCQITSAGEHLASFGLAAANSLGIMPLYWDMHNHPENRLTFLSKKFLNYQGLTVSI